MTPSKLHEELRLNSMDVQYIIKAMMRYIKDGDLQTKSYAHRCGVRRATLHLYHVASGLRMIESDEYEDIKNIYDKIKTDER